jgi:hypothetical protein
MEERAQSITNPDMEALHCGKSSNKAYSQAQNTYYIWHFIYKQGSN